MKTILAVAAFLPALVGSSLAGAAELKVGDPAPTFCAAASDGTTVCLKDLLGKGFIVLYFYPKDDTPGCTTEACGIRDAWADLAKLNAAVYGVSYDSIDSHKRFIDKHQLPFPLLADTDRKIAEAYGATRTLLPMAARKTFVIDKAGRIAALIPKVTPATHADELKKILAGLGATKGEGN